MNKQELQKLMLTLKKIKSIKEEAVCGQPYAERVSLALALNLLFNRENRGDYHSILDELNHLESIAPATRTKPEGKFKRGVINFLYHKHYSSARHIGNRNFKRPFCLDRKVSKNSFTDQSPDFAVRNGGVHPASRVGLAHVSRLGPGCRSMVACGLGHCAKGECAQELNRNQGWDEAVSASDHHSRPDPPSATAQPPVSVAGDNSRPDPLRDLTLRPKVSYTVSLEGGTTDGSTV